jgi:hypothetical protein
LIEKLPVGFLQLRRLVFGGHFCSFLSNFASQPQGFHLGFLGRLLCKIRVADLFHLLSPLSFDSEGDISVSD